MESIKDYIVEKGESEFQINVIVKEVMDAVSVGLERGIWEVENKNK